MTRRHAARVVLVNEDRFSMVDNWIDQIELRRDARGVMTVVGSKYGDHPDNGRQCWFELIKTGSLKSPLAVMKALNEAAEYLDVEIEWCDAIEGISELDWISAVVIAQNLGEDIPSLPPLDVIAMQRSFRSLGKVVLSVMWGYEPHELVLPFERWLRILRGEHHVLKAHYWYEGQRFTSEWSFDGQGALDIICDVTGIGWSGGLNAVDSVSGLEVDGIDIASLALVASNK